MLSDNPNAQIRRKLLEELPEAQKISPAKPFVNYRSLPMASSHGSQYVLRQLEILEQEGRVKLKKHPTAPECMVNLTPLGWKSLETTEDVWLRGTSATPPATNATHLEFHNSTVGNVSHVSGSHEVSINQTNTLNDLQQLSTAIDRLMGAVKVSPSLGADVKKDAQIEADQLKGEVQKSKPNPNRIQQTLDWFKALDTAATVVPHLLDVADKLKHYFPGVL